MPFKIIRNDITKMKTDAIVNTANNHVSVGGGCDYAIHMAAGFDQLLEYRKNNVGYIEEGEAFITPGFQLSCQYIIHGVSPKYIDGNHQEEEKLRHCYKRCLELASDYEVKSISFPLISTGGFGYPLEEGLRIAIDEISFFLMNHSMMVYIVVFDEKANQLGKNVYPDLESYIDTHYVEQKEVFEYSQYARSNRPSRIGNIFPTMARFSKVEAPVVFEDACCEKDSYAEDIDVEYLEKKLDERLKHRSDTFSQYLMYLIEQKGKTNKEVYTKSCVSKKIFSKIKNYIDYHPKKITALCFCIGLQLNLDETKDLLSRAGYALSPSDKTDIIFSYFIENEIYDILELDIQLEQHGMNCIIQ